jgi:hypothetical protein
MRSCSDFSLCLSSGHGPGGLGFEGGPPGVNLCICLRAVLSGSKLSKIETYLPQCYKTSREKNNTFQ